MAPRKGRGEPEVRLSASGLSRLGECETRWLWSPDDGAPELAPGRPLDLGTIVHRGVEARLVGDDWMAALESIAPTGWEPGYHLPDPFPTAVYLMERHEIVYPTLPQCVAAENQFELWLPPPTATTSVGIPPTKVRGRMDGLVLLTADDLLAMAAPPECVPGLYVWETKTMGQWSRLDWVPIDPQLGTYVWAAREMGFQVKGVVYDAILSTHWKTEEGETYKSGPRKGQPKTVHPPEDSFRREVFPVNEKLVAATLDDYHRAARRAGAIQKDPDSAIRSVGRNCPYCPAFLDCHGEVLS